MKQRSFGMLLSFLMLAGLGLAAGSAWGQEETQRRRPDSKNPQPKGKRSKDELKELLALAQTALDAAETFFGADSTEVATAVAELAKLYGELGQFADAAPLLERGLKILESRWGKDHPALIIALNNLAGLHEMLGQTKKAVELLDRSRRITRRYVAEVLPALSEAEQAVFLEYTEHVAFPEALSLGLRHARDLGVTAYSAAWVLNGKASVHQALAESILLLRDTKDPLLTDLAQKLWEVRQELAQLTVTPPKKGQEAQVQQRRETLSARELELSRLLRLAGGFGREAEWIELNALRQSLPQDAVFIDIACFPVADFRGNEDQTVHYAAWITPRRGEVVLIDLGPAQAIDRDIKEVRQALNGAVRQMRLVGEPDAEAALRVPLEKLAKRILHPLLPHIGKTTRWIISPDSNLWLVPWAALPLPGDKYALEEHVLSYVVSGRDLVSAARAGVKQPQEQTKPLPRPSRPLLLANPDFDLGLSKADREARQLPDSGESTRGLSAALELGRVPRLPYTAIEAEAIAPKVRRYTGLEPIVSTDKQARAEVFLKARNPKVVVLSTHGYFLPDQATVPRRPGEKEPSRPPKGWENPLLRCGLLLAGCNNAAKAKQGADNGVLTGLQIVGADLRGCELVVLSACQTGLGVVRNGEGVAGLRQAFQLAGADSVIATLWQVPDQQSAQLMVRFFDNLADKQNKADALRNAQLALIKARRAKHDAAHPHFWAAFTLTGQ